MDDLRPRSPPLCPKSGSGMTPRGALPRWKDRTWGGGRQEDKGGQMSPGTEVMGGGDRRWPHVGSMRRQQDREVARCAHRYGASKGQP